MKVDKLKRKLVSTVRHAYYQINTALALVDPIFMVNSEVLPAPLFILGVPRSGTTLLYQGITQHFRVGYFVGWMNYLYGAPNLLLRLSAPFLSRPAPSFQSHYGKVKGGFFAPVETGSFWFRWFPRDGENGQYVSADTLTEQHYQSLRENIASLSLIAGKPLVFKSVYLDMWIGILAKIFPEARFIFVKRDLLLTAQSLLKGRWQRKDPASWWSVRPPGYQKLMSLPLWQQVTEQAFYTHQIVARDLEKYADGRYFTVDYLNYCENPRQILADLAIWLQDCNYQTYAEVQVPATFRASTEITVDPRLAQKIADHLEYLEKEVSFEIE